MRELARIDLEIAGLGLILCSPFATAHIAEGERYLEQHYWEPADVARHLRAGTIAGFCTGSSGTYRVRVVIGAPDTRAIVTHPWMVRLAVEVRDRTLWIRDLYDLLRWERACPRGQAIELDDGLYRVTAATAPTDSGIVGDDQDILLCLEPVDALPALTWEGVPFLGEDPDDLPVT
jgi:hypothetical protein